MANNKPRTDWEEVESHYRAGMLSIKALAKRAGVSDTAVRKHAKKHGWPRDLSAKIKIKAADIVRRKQAEQAVEPKEFKFGPKERDLVDANAQVQADIILSHCRDVPKRRALVDKLLAEVESITDNRDLVNKLVESLATGDTKAMAMIAKKVASLPQRISGVASLVSAYKTMVELERKVFSIDSVTGEGEEPGAIGSLDVQETARFLTTFEPAGSEGSLPKPVPN